MAKDQRYNTVKKLILSDQTLTLADIIVIVPKTVIAKDLDMHHDTFNNQIDEPEKFTLGKLFKLAELIGVEEEIFVKFVMQEALRNKRSL